MRTILLLAACTAALTACAGNEAAVRASATHAFGEGARTYALATDSATAADAETEAYASAIERRLTELGFAATPAKTAHYRIALSHETRPASVGIDYTRCAEAMPCGAPVLPPGFEWPGRKAYVHSLTLRFFDPADGREIYKVSPARRDRASDARGDVDDLVASALAQVPFAGPEPATRESGGKTDWKVTLSQPDAGGAVRIKGIAPLAR